MLCLRIRSIWFYQPNPTQPRIQYRIPNTYLVHADPIFPGNVHDQGPESWIVGIGHVNEAWSNGAIRANEWGRSLQVDVVVEHHQVSRHDAARHQRSHCGGDHELLAAKQFERIDWHAQLFGIDTFVQMHATLEASYVETIQLAEDEAAAVARNGGHGETRDVLVPVVVRERFEI